MHRRMRNPFGRIPLKALAIAVPTICLSLACLTGIPGLPPFADRPVIGRIDPTVFPRNFMWGAASSAHQVEGNDVHSDWWAWEQAGRVRSGQPSGLATDHWNRYAEDLDRLVALNLNTYRFSLNWARLYPQPGMSQPDPDAVARYDAMFAAMAARKIRPMVTLHHFSMPAWLTDQDRWGSGQAIEDFKKLTQFAVDRWKGDVDWWITVNEPEVFAFHGWSRGVFPPGKLDFPLSLRVLANLMKAHAEAYHIIKDHDDVDADGDGSPAEVGIAHLVVPFEPYNPWNPIEATIATAISTFSNAFWFVADRTGIIDLRLPFGPEIVEEFPLFQGTLDFIGINYYSRQLMRIDPLRGGLVIDQYPGVVRSSLGIEVYPKGLYDSINFVAQFGLPIIVTENGIADETDELRPDYIHDHLAEMSRFMRDRPDVPVLGYVYWSLTDNFEWEKGFTPRFGLYEVNYETLERTMRPSAAAFAEIIAAINNNRD